MDIFCQSDFPSTNNPADAAVVKRVKSLIDGLSAKYSVFQPSKEDQAGYDVFFFILKDLSTGTRYVQLIETTLSAGRVFYRSLCEEAGSCPIQSLPWVGIDVEDIIVVLT